jgi:hypothetical protein
LYCLIAAFPTESTLVKNFNRLYKIRLTTRFSFFISIQNNEMKTPFNKVLYIGFLLLGIYQAVFTKDYMQAAASLGIGMAFDPFNPEQKWNERPIWQKVILIVHLGLVAAMFGLGIGLHDK